MAGSLNARVMEDYISVKSTRPLNNLEQLEISSSIPKKVKKNASKPNMKLIFTAFSLLMAEALIYFHSVHVEVSAGKLQKEIVKLKEANYQLNVELEKTKELSNVEKIAEHSLKMKPSVNNEVKYMIMPEVSQSKNSFKISANVKVKRIEIPTGY